MFNATSSGLVRLVIGVGAVAVVILLLFAGLVRAAELDRCDALVNSPMTEGRPAPETSNIYAMICLDLGEDGAMVFAAL